MNRIEQLEKRIKELEYRLGVVEKFLDESSMLHHKDDESLMNYIKLKMLANSGLEMEENRDRLGTKFYVER